MSPLNVRERPPLRLSADVQFGTKHTRWAQDEHCTNNALEQVVFSSTMPGGFEQASCVLERRTDFDFLDDDQFATQTLYGPGGDVLWQGRIEGLPRASGEQSSVSPQAVGWQSALNDNAAVRELFVDIDLSKWQGPSVQRQINNTIAAQDTDGASLEPDSTTGAPSLKTGLAGAWARFAICEGWYDAKGLPIGSIQYAWKKNAAIVLPDANWNWYAFLCADDVASANDNTANLAGAGPGSGTLTATTATRKFALVLAYYAAAGGAANADYSVFWTMLAVLGNQGLTTHTTLDGTPGFLASDLANYLVPKYTSISTVFGGSSTIQPSTFVLPIAVWTDPMRLGDVLNEITSYELLDWGVWEGPTYWQNPRGMSSRAKTWRARVGPSNLQETGPAVDRILNSVVVMYTDVTGITRTVGPPGSGANVTDSSLVDADTQNPATLAGLTKRGLLTLSTSTPAAAIKIGAAFLVAQKQISTAGSATVTGHVLDDHGVMWPASKIRAGDAIVFTDSHSPSTARRIVRASHDNSTHQTTVDLDSPPDGLQQLLARMSATLSPLGFS